MEGCGDKLPTPPDEERPPAVISVSTTFFPGAPHSTIPSDLILISADRVLFHLHAHRVLTPSTNGFAHKWPPQSRSVNSATVPIILVPELSPVLNLVLHCVYDLPCTRFPSTAEDVSACVATITKYGLPLSTHTLQDGPLYNLVLSKAPTAAIHMYALAAQHRLEQLAVALSPFLLSFDLATLTDDLVGRMGAIYLKRLVFLHLGRSAALKRLLSPPLNYHTPDDTCGTREHDALMNTWSLAVASLAWDARPDLVPTAINTALEPLVDVVSCSRCRKGIQQTIKSLVAAWVGIKTTI
ncbi:hypothetical protein BDM02DRAFT_2755808 [Thelephora ganbajun]|uniref:Uncharacterized protein n=1 Tax=Thelephora ganbajun TaxID=370292 RepID=A0ACB6ZRL7_THEGA|nr:hypothetical protein BDM02DRAFT_2755808 [Thelephora ganbajun]